jgi:hypothetical protein
MVVHQHIGMQLTSGSEQSLFQQLQIALSVVAIQKTWQPVVAALHDMLRNTGKVESWKSGHASRIYGVVGRWKQPQTDNGVGVSRYAP